MEIDAIQSFIMGVPAAAVLVRYLILANGTLTRAVNALERIADKLDTADYIHLREVK